MTRPRPLAWAVALVVVLRPQVAMAWGDQGHRIVGALAWHHLSPSARAKVEALLGEAGPEALAEAAVWADEIAKPDPAYRWANSLHYVNVPFDAVAYDGPRDCPQGCVVSAIGDQAAILANPSRPTAQRREALRFVTHFVGDIHQPLHVAHPDDRGGTQTHVTWNGGSWHVHALWDVAVFESRGVAWQPEVDRLQATWVPALVGQPSVTSVDPARWANESLILAQGHASAPPVVTRAWLDRAWPVVELRLALAGLRLAAVLEHSLNAR